jgi:putative membrane protein
MSTKTRGMHSTRRLVTAAAGLALALTAAPSRPLHGQSTQDTAKKSPWVLPPSPTRPSTQGTGQVAADSGFIREAASMNLMEVRLGTLAGQRASNTEVKQFGRQMVASHSAMGRQWESLAAKNGLPASVNLNSIQQQSADQLSKLSGADFDRAYMSAMVADHEQDAGTLQRIGAAAQSAEVKGLAASGFAATQEHLSRAQVVASQVGAPTAVATSSPVSPTPASPASPTNAGAGRRNVTGGSVTDGRYARELAYGHIMEVRLAQMAQKRAKNKEVKQFADQVADDFGTWRQRWMDLASKYGMKANPNMGPLHQQKIQRLEKASTGNFDQVYLDIVVENLGSMLPYLQKEGRAANAADIRSAVNEELPSVREKLSTAQRLDRQVQASGKVKGKGRSLSNKE